MDFWTWVTSGWGDAATQWQDPIGSIENSVGSVFGLSAGNSGGSDQNPNSSGVNFTEGAVVVVIILILILLILGKVEAL